MLIARALGVEIVALFGRRVLDEFGARRAVPNVHGQYG